MITSKFYFSETLD